MGRKEDVAEGKWYLYGSVSSQEAASLSLQQVKK